MESCRLSPPLDIAAMDVFVVPTIGATASGRRRSELQGHCLARVVTLHHRAGCQRVVVDGVESAGKATIGECKAGPVVDNFTALGDVPALASLGPYGVAQSVLQLGVEAVLNVSNEVPGTARRLAMASLTY